MSSHTSAVLLERSLAKAMLFLFRKYELTGRGHDLSNERLVPHTCLPYFVARI